VNVGTDLETSKQVVALAEKYSNCYAIVGQHPNHDVSGADSSAESGASPDVSNNFNYSEFKKLAEHPRVVAIGECGLDYFREPFSKEKQEKVFREHIRLAMEVGKPLMIHARNSYADILKILEEYLIGGDVKLRGNVHFFAGTVDEAQGFLKLGFSLSFTGVITFANQYNEVVQMVPAEQILSETDCPFVSPVPFRGQRNSPLNIPIIVGKMAEIRGIQEDLMASCIKSNAEGLFGIQF
jgi:TatD DNase family protein